jgi:hypothetical protein
MMRLTRNVYENKQVRWVLPGMSLINKAVRSFLLGDVGYRSLGDRAPVATSRTMLALSPWERVPDGGGRVRGVVAELTPHPSRSGW